MQSVDGDGLVVRRDPLSTESVLYLRSTVLGGKVITEINAMGTNVIWTIPRGGKLRSYVYNGAMRVATQEVQATSPPSQSLIWSQLDPVTGTEIRENDNSAFQGIFQEPDPQGINVGLQDPADYPPPAPDPVQPEYFGAGAWNPLQPSYTLDGIRIDAAFAEALGSFAVRAPAEETITIIRHGRPMLARWQAFADGYQGFVPVGARYVGDGQLRYGAGRPSLYRRAPGAPEDTDLARLNGATEDADLGRLLTMPDSVPPNTGQTPTPTPQMPIWCQPDVIKAMNRAWAQTQNGMSGNEAGFVLNGSPSNYTIVDTKSGYTKNEQKMTVYDDTFLLFHVHPNSSTRNPSTPENNARGDRNSGDTTISDRFQSQQPPRTILFLVGHRTGLTMYDPRTKKNTDLRENLDWTKPCK
ncbi:MAG: hypothetical protein U0Z53_29630 [Blastocatellia bacterium]